MTETLITGRSIEGEIPRYTQRSKTAQKGVDEFLANLDAILAVPGLEAVRWEQYTPYFNDGDPCEFRVGEITLKFEGDEEGGDYEDGFHETWGLTYKNAEGNYPYGIDGIDEEVLTAIRELDTDWGAYEDVLQDNFGDPAQVTATKEGFSVDYYDHD